MMRTREKIMIKAVASIVFVGLTYLAFSFVALDFAWIMFDDYQAPVARVMFLVFCVGVIVAVYAGGEKP